MIRVGKRIQKLGSNQRFRPTRRTDAEEARSPIGADVKEEEVLGSGVANVAKSAEIFLSDV
jgi:hypothetical protein